MNPSRLELKKLTDPISLKKILPHLSDKKIILTGGVFDLLKPFHVDLLEFAANLGDILVVAVNKEAMYTPLEERLEILNEIEGIDYLLLFKDKLPQNIFQNSFNEIILNKEFDPAGISPDFSGNIIRFSI